MWINAINNSKAVQSLGFGNLCVLVLEGEDAIARVRALNGATDPTKAAPGTIRGDYGTVCPYNVVHASSSARRR